MNKKKNIVMVTMLAVVAVMSIAYAFFATNLNITSTGNISSSWDVKFTGITNDTPVGSATNVTTPSYTATTATMSADLKLPGDSITYRITLKNNGDIPAIIEDIDASATGSGAIIFSISGLNIGEKLAAKEEKIIAVKIEYDPNTTSQPQETTKTLTVSIRAVQDTGQDMDIETPNVAQGTYLKNAIFRDNIVYADNVRSEFVDSDTGIDFSKKSSDTNGKGLYYTSINTENNGTTYYFRGDVENNYVQLGNYSNDVYFGYYYPYGTSSIYSYNAFFKEYSTLEECQNASSYNLDCSKVISANDPILWRIVRINEDGSVRLMTEKPIGAIDPMDAKNDNAYVGYMYGTPGSDNYIDTHKNINESPIKKYLDQWYEDNLNNNYSTLSAEAGFCNDRSINKSSSTTSSYSNLGYGEESTWYGATARAYYNDDELQFKCPQTNDLFTIKSSPTGNKALSYSIGLITADEFYYSGMSGSYLMNKGLSVYPFLTMSPFHFVGTARYIFIEDGGTSDFTSGATSGSGGVLGVRPVINIKWDTMIELAGTGEPGTATNPYIIKTN